MWLSEESEILYEIAQKFMNMENEAKDLYIKRIHDTVKKFDGFTITHLLLLFNPRFLELDLPWVDSLLNEEIDIIGKYGLTSLACLLQS